MEIPQQTIRQEDFLQLQEPTLPSPLLPPLEVLTEIVLAAGDFNSHHLWLGSPCPFNSAGRQLYASFENSEHDYFLNDVRNPTHIRHGRLDLAFSSSRLASLLHQLGRSTPPLRVTTSALSLK